MNEEYEKIEGKVVELKQMTDSGGCHAIFAITENGDLYRNWGCRWIKENVNNGETNE